MLVPHQGMFELFGVLANVCICLLTMLRSRSEASVCSLRVSHCSMHRVGESDKSPCLLSDSAQQVVNWTLSFYMLLYQLFFLSGRRRENSL